MQLASQYPNGTTVTTRLGMEMKVITEKGMSYCTDCKTQVVWAQKKDGKWYVADRGYQGRPVGPHYPTCLRLQKALAAEVIR